MQNETLSSDGDDDHHPFTFRSIRQMLRAVGPDEPYDPADLFLNAEVNLYHVYDALNAMLDAAEDAPKPPSDAQVKKALIAILQPFMDQPSRMFSPNPIPETVGSDPLAHLTALFALPPDTCPRPSGPYGRAVKRFQKPLLDLFQETLNDLRQRSMIEKPLDVAEILTEYLEERAEHAVDLSIAWQDKPRT